MSSPRSIFLVFGGALVGLGLLGCGSSAPTQSPPRDDAVHTGYSTEKRSESTTSTSSVTPSQADKNNARDLSDLLQGRAAGVEVSQSGGGVRILIRGPSSFLADNTPLYVVDGIPVSPGPDGVVPVNPRDVRSITVLKDAGSTAIYGSRGANGVIVIETGR